MGRKFVFWAKQRCRICRGNSSSSSEEK